MAIGEMWRITHMIDSNAVYVGAITIFRYRWDGRDGMGQAFAWNSVTESNTPHEVVVSLTGNGWLQDYPLDEL